MIFRTEDNVQSRFCGVQQISDPDHKGMVFFQLSAHDSLIPLSNRGFSSLDSEEISKASATSLASAPAGNLPPEATASAVSRILSRAVESGRKIQTHSFPHTPVERADGRQLLCLVPKHVATYLESSVGVSSDDGPKTEGGTSKPGHPFLEDWPVDYGRQIHKCDVHHGRTAGSWTSHPAW